MVKLRGVNVSPEAVGAAVAQDGRSNGECFCIVERVGETGRDEMTVMVEVADAACETRIRKGAASRYDQQHFGAFQKPCWLDTFWSLC